MFQTVYADQPRGRGWLTDWEGEGGMAQTRTLIEEVLTTKLGIPAPTARWGSDGNQWLFCLHRTWLKLDITGEGTGDLIVLTCPIGMPPMRNLGRFHSFLLAKNFHLPGPALWCQGGVFGLREVRYVDGLQPLGVVDMAELMTEVSAEVIEEVLAFKTDGLQLLGERDERAVHRVASAIGHGL
jgi:hypothetical protein